MGFAPLCKVSEGMDVVDALNGEYGEKITRMQGEIHEKGNAYLREKWPNLDYIKTAVIDGNGAGASPSKSETSSSSSSQEGPGIVPFLLGGMVLAAILY